MHRPYGLNQLAICGLATILAIGTDAAAEVVVITADRDNTIFSEGIATSNGIGDHIFAGVTVNGGIRRALVHFDVATAVPAGSTINSVSLEMQMTRSTAGNQAVAVHRVLADWGEGFSNAPGQEGGGTTSANNDATWRYRFYNSSDPGSSPVWNTLGGDFVGAASASIVVGSTGPYTWSSTATTVADVQSWLDTPATNFGWIIIANEGANRTAKRFDSRENAAAPNRPMLRIDFSQVGSGACCEPGNACTVTVPTTCAAMGGTFEGAGTICTPNPCMSGACCQPGLVCTLETAADCATLGGTFEGLGTVCAPNPCMTPTGACCTNAGICTILTEAVCNNLNRDYLGDGTSCTPSPCPQPGACCLIDGSCQLQLEADCDAAGGIFQGEGTGCTAGLCTTCTKGDVNQDTVIDGLDIDGFVTALIDPPGAGPTEFCATDMNDNGTLEITDDLSAFIDCLLLGC